MFARQRFPHSYKECFVLLPNRCGISQFTPFGTQRLCCHSFPSPIDVGPPFLPPIHPIWGQRLCWHTARVHHSSRLSLLAAHRSVSAYDTICNSPNPPLIDIVLFGLSLKVFKMHMLGRDFHTFLKNASFSSPTYMGSHRFQNQRKF